MTSADPDRSRWLADAQALGKISRVRPNPRRSDDLLVQARRHVGSARLLAREDPTLALAACHDAVRKAIDADAGVNGFRFENVPGAHRATLDYARTQLGGSVGDEDLDALDRLRRRRHGAEYGEVPAGSVQHDEIEEFALVAERVVHAIVARRVVAD